MRTDCQFEQDAHAYVSGELSSADQERYEQHLSVCPRCNAAVESIRVLNARLLGAPGRAPSKELEGSVMRRIARESKRSPGTRYWRQIAAAAALVMIGAGLALLSHGPVPAPSLQAEEIESRATHALDWFVRNQERDGTWDVERWGGHPRFGVALTALPLIALLQGERTPERETAVSRAVDAILRKQNPDGTFGETFREAPYVQGVSAVALFQAYERRPTPTLRAALDSVLRVALVTQMPDGGWGYQLSPAPSMSITLWYREALECAVRLGWDSARPALERANEWLAAQPVEKAVPVSTDSTDYHRAYFAACNLRRDGSAEALRQLAALRTDILHLQSAGGTAAGTWSPSDQWGRAGGRIYATAMASMTLKQSL